MTIGYRIKELRTTRGLSQGDLATTCQITQGAISQIERDAVMPTVESLIAICRALSTDLNQIVFGQNTIPHIDPARLEACLDRIESTARARFQALSPKHKSKLICHILAADTLPEPAQVLMLLNLIE
jgi:transcriptional regulator with XRE-family HTH domain